MRKRLLLLLLVATVAWNQGSLTTAPVRLTPQERIQFRARQAQRVAIATQALAAERGRLQLENESQFTPGRAVLDPLGQLHIRYPQFYGGVRVAGAEAIVHLDRNDRVKSVTGELARALNLKTTPTISAKEATDLATADYAPGGGEVEAESNLLIYRPAEGAAKLTWRIRLEGEEEPLTTYYVDAHSGAILDKSVAELTADYDPATGVGQSGWNAPTQFSFGRATNPPNAFTGPFRLLDPTRGGSRVVNMQQKKATRNWDGEAYWNPDTTWGSPNHYEYETMSTTSPEGVASGVDAAIAMQRLWDMLANVFDRDGIDGNGLGMRARVHARKKSSEPYGDAFWSPKSGYAHFGDAKGSSRTDRSTVGHEFGHMLFQYALGEEDFSGEARGLNEGHADIVGSLVNIYHLDNRGVGDELPVQVSRSRFRSRMVNPSGYHDGAGRKYYQAGMGNLQEHDQGCAYGHAFVMLAYGASSTIGDHLYSEMLPNGMVGIGVHKAAEIWYLALTGYMGSSPTFAQVRNAYVAAAEDLYGASSLEVKAVRNAFFGIKVGGAAADQADPTANLALPIINENEMSAFVNMSAQDDLGVSSLELRLDGALVKKLIGAGPKSWYGYISIAGLALGNHTLRVTARDAEGNTRDVTRNFSLSGRNRLIQNGRFEESGADWIESSNSLYQTNSDVAFLESRYAMFGQAGQFIYQTVSVPASATAATLSYRLRTEMFPSALGSEILRVDVLNNAGTLLETLANHNQFTGLGDESANGYRHFSYSLRSYAGQTIRIRFFCLAAMPTRYKLDNVALVWSGPVDADLDVDVDAAEGSVIFRATNIANLQPAQVRSVTFVVNGTSLPPDLQAPYLLMLPASEFTPNVNYRVRAQIRNQSNSLAGTTEEQTFMIRPVTNLLKAPDFEILPSTAWSRTGGTDFCLDGGEAMQSNAFMGRRCAYFDGSEPTQILSQQVYLPDDADVLTLGFRLRVLSAQEDPNDRFEVRLLNTNDQVLETVGVFSGATETHQAANPRGYMAVKINITEHKGQMVRVQFRARHQAPRPTTFFLDNTSLVAKKFGVAGAP